MSRHSPPEVFIINIGEELSCFDELEEKVKLMRHQHSLSFGNEAQGQSLLFRHQSSSLTDASNTMSSSSAALIGIVFQSLHEEKEGVSHCKITSVCVLRWKGQKKA